MMSGGANGRYRVMSEINMVPMIDVALTLLLMFMIMTPFLMKAQIRIDLPVSQAADRPPAVEDSIEVQVRRDGAVFVEGRQIDPEAIEDVLRESLTDPANQTVMIVADKAVRFERVVSVMGAAKKLGAAKMGVRVVEKKDGPAGGSD